jgi:hypothetical protein
MSVEEAMRSALIAFMASSEQREHHEHSQSRRPFAPTSITVLGALLYASVGTTVDGNLSADYATACIR